MENYGLTLEPAVAGMLYDLTDKTVDSFAAEGALEAGVPVVRGTDPAKQVKAAESGADVIGVAMHTHKELRDPYYPEGWAVPVVTKGRVWVAVDGAVTAGTEALYDATNGVFSASNGESLGCGAVFITSTEEAGVAVIEIG